MKERRRIQVRGVVQGVGFRPFVYSLATCTGLTGQVLNDAAGVTIEVEGETAVLDNFTTALQTDAPPLAVIEQITAETLPLSHNGHRLREFSIVQSQAAAQRNTFISPDVATCDDCLRELFDPTNRRYRYPFINCTNCGPRFTIIEDVPYDRPFTTMSSFALCADCQAEYDDPHNRRFHAQPNGCPVCGPQVSLVMNNETMNNEQWAVANFPISQSPINEDAITRTQALLAQGAIVAIKGLGGYHLACDATNEVVVQRLRTRKHRWDKPFALLAADLTAVQTFCQLNKAEEQLLLDRKRPIVLLRRKRDTAVASAVAPNQKTLGVMLPYTPLHHLLLYNSPCPLLVMTSGNRSDEPIVYRDEEVTDRLDNIADAVLSHNRAIHMRCDDSVARIYDNRQLIIRRSRGYAPQPLAVGFEFGRPVLAVGGHLKNSFCLGKGRYAFLSHHIGDLDNLETLTSFHEGISHFKRLFDVAPQVVAHDLHPDYLSTRYALEQEGLTAVAVQHHHAHIASVMAEHHLTEPLVGVAFDGTGYGTDGTVWGGEFLVADLAAFERVAHLRQVSLPGGEQAVKQPWRVTAAWLNQMNNEAMNNEQWAMNDEQRATWDVLQQMIERGVNSPLTSSMGRLFDAVAALLGVRQEVSYEGQAAIELEAIADESVMDGYSFCLCWPQLDPAPVFAEMMEDLRLGVPVPVIAAKFHNGVAGLVTAVCFKLRQERNLNQVALSGGVFQNVFLLSRTLKLLQEQGFDVFTNQLVPPNDGGLALGQAVIAMTNEDNDQ